jgi:signal transduction histidine kinase
VVTTASHSLEHDGAFPRGRELLGILAFWLLFAAVSLTNMLFPPGDNGPPVTPAVIGVSVSYAALWAIATLPVFWLARRFPIDTTRRVRRIALYLVAGLALALAVDVIMELLRHSALPPPPRGRFGPGGERSLWAGVQWHLLNEFTVYSAMLAAGIARDYFIRYQRRLAEAATLRTQLAEARLTALQNQLNPHFLFNTLNAVAALVERDPAGVRRMIARLSELLRATLESGSEVEVPLSRELALASRYLDILQIRFEGRLTTRLDAPADLQNALVPQLILQPLIENAMKHAVGQTSIPSRIAVSVQRQDYDLVLAVADTGANGVGPISGGTGIGLQNTRARLQQLYADEQDLSLASNDIGGTTVTIRLPYHTTPIA